MKDEINKLKINKKYYPWILAGIIFSIGLILALFRFASKDEVVFLQDTMLISEAIRNGNWFGNENVGVHGFLLKLPIAIIYLLTGPNIFVATLSNIIFASLSAFLTYILLLKIVKTEKWAFLGTLMVFFSYPLVHSYPTYLRDIPALFIILLFYYSIVTKKNIWILSILILLILDAKEYLFFIVVPPTIIWIILINIREYSFKNFKFYLNTIKNIIIILLPSVFFIIIMMTTTVIPYNTVISKILQLNKSERGLMKNLGMSPEQVIAKKPIEKKSGHKEISLLETNNDKITYSQKNINKYKKENLIKKKVVENKIIEEPKELVINKIEKNQINPLDEKIDSNIVKKKERKLTKASDNEKDTTLPQRYVSKDTDIRIVQKFNQTTQTEKSKQKEKSTQTKNIEKPSIASKNKQLTIYSNLINRISNTVQYPNLAFVNNNNLNQTPFYLNSSETIESILDTMLILYYNQNNEYFSTIFQKNLNKQEKREILEASFINYLKTYYLTLNYYYGHFEDILLESMALRASIQKKLYLYALNENNERIISESKNDFTSKESISNNIVVKEIKIEPIQTNNIKLEKINQEPDLKPLKKKPIKKPKERKINKNIILLTNFLIAYSQKILYPRVFSFLSFPFFILIPSIIMAFSIFRRWRKEQPEISFFPLLFTFYLMIYIITWSHNRYLMHLFPIIILFFILILIDSKNNSKLLKISLFTSLPFTIGGIFFELHSLYIKIPATLFFYFILFMLAYREKFPIKMTQETLVQFFIISYFSFTLISSIYAGYDMGQIDKYKKFGENGEYEKIAKYFDNDKVYWFNGESRLIKFFNRDTDNRPIRDEKYTLKDWIPRKNQFKIDQEDFYNFTNVNRKQLVTNFKINKIAILKDKYNFNEYNEIMDKVINNTPDWLLLENKVNLKNKSLYIYKVR